MYHDFDFEWDERKNRKNIAKHKIDFRDAVSIFSDDGLLVRLDDRYGYDEDRYQAIGKANRILFVVFTEKINNTIRIISARKATKREQDRYRQSGFLI